MGNHGSPNPSSRGISQGTLRASARPPPKIPAKNLASHLGKTITQPVPEVVHFDSTQSGAL